MGSPLLKIIYTRHDCHHIATSMGFYDILATTQPFHQIFIKSHFQNVPFFSTPLSPLRIRSLSLSPCHSICNRLFIWYTTSMISYKRVISSTYGLNCQISKWFAVSATTVGHSNNTQCRRMFKNLFL